jgi:hypothetical protein
MLLLPSACEYIPDAVVPNPSACENCPVASELLPCDSEPVSITVWFNGLTYEAVAAKELEVVFTTVVME